MKYRVEAEAGMPEHDTKEIAPVWVKGILYEYNYVTRKADPGGSVLTGDKNYYEVERRRYIAILDAEGDELVEFYYNPPEDVVWKYD